MRCSTGTAATFRPMMKLAATVLAVSGCLALPATAAVPPPHSAPSPVVSTLRFVLRLDHAGKVVRFEGKTIALVVLSTECPIARKAIGGDTGVNAGADKLAADNVELFGVISDPTVTRAAAVDFARAHGVKFPVLFDAIGELATLLAPERVREAFAPERVREAFVYDSTGSLGYRGRINNAYVALGQPRAAVTEENLLDAALAVVRQKLVKVDRTEPVG